MTSTWGDYTGTWNSGVDKVTMTANAIFKVQNVPFLGDGKKFAFWKALWRTKKNGAALNPAWARGPFWDRMDWFNGAVTPSLLLAFIAFIAYVCSAQPKTKGTYLGASGPVWCLPSKEIENAEDYDYALDYCQSQNHYYLEPHEMLDWRRLDAVRPTTVRVLGYYHWIQLVLSLMVFVVAVLNYVLTRLQSAWGPCFTEMVGHAYGVNKQWSLCHWQRHAGCMLVAEKVYEQFFPQNGRHAEPGHRFCGLYIGRRLGFSLAVSYTLFKLLQTAVVLCMFLWLDAFVGDGFGSFWGWQVFVKVLNQEVWQDSRVFPRTSYCRVPIRHPGDTGFYTLQCHLRANTYNEKIFYFLWFYLLFLAFFTFCSMLYYIYFLLFFPSIAVSSVYDWLTQDEFEGIVWSWRKKISARNRLLVREFALDHLGYDGILLFKFIENAAGPVMARDICAHVFSKYANIPLKNRLKYKPEDKEELREAYDNLCQQQEEGSEEEGENGWDNGAGNEQQEEQQQSSGYGTTVKQGDNRNTNMDATWADHVNDDKKKRNTNIDELWAVHVTGEKQNKNK